MYKTKEGKVCASLTEVKNRTGDIFDMVDEFGEVILTSYNKERYKITKIDLGSTLEIKSESKNKVEEKIKQYESTVQVEDIKVEAKPTPAEEPKKDEDDGMISDDFKLWDRENALEKEFVENAKKALQ